MRAGSTRRHATLALAAVLGAMVLPSGGVAQEAYPARNITIIVGFPPGGGVDVVARLMADKLSAMFGKPVVVENRAGASGSLATRQVATMKPDGYTLLMNSNSIVANQVINSKAGHDIERELTPVMKVAGQPNILVASPDLDVKTLADVIALSQKRELDFGSPGVGSIPHLAAEYLFTLTGAKAKHIPFPGAAQALTAVAGGHVPLALVTAPPAVTLVQGGKLKGIVVTSAQRMAALPQVPTVIETGTKDFVIDTWAGFFVPAGTPKPVLDQLQEAMLKVLAMPDVKERLSALGFEQAGTRSEAFAAEIKAELVRWKDVAAKAKIAL